MTRIATVVASAKASVARKAEDRKASGTRIEHEPGAANVGDEGRAAVDIDFAAQIADVNIDGVRVGVEAVAPHAFQQHRARDDLPRPAQEKLQELEFARQQFDFGVAAPHGLLDQVHFEIAGPQLARARVVDAAQQGLDPRRQLRHGERLYEIVVAPRLQALDALVHRRKRRDHENGGLETLLSQSLDYRKAVCAAQHAIDDQYRRFAGPRVSEALGDALHRARAIAETRQFGGDFLGEAVLVLDDQHMAALGVVTRHERIPWRGIPPRETLALSRRRRGHKIISVVVAFSDYLAACVVIPS